MSSTAVSTKSTLPPQPRILVVDDEPTLIELVDDVVRGQIDCRITAARTLREAREILAEEPVELLVADVRLPDGDGLSLLGDLRRCHPLASAIVITGAPSVDRAISAMRQGAVDFVPKPFSAEQLLERVQTALKVQAARVKEDMRIDRLRQAVKRLSEARRLVTRKVDLLCNDLVSAYGELSRELDVVRTQEGFRKSLAEARDLEQLLCHAMDWMLRQFGNCNIAVWLAADDHAYQLGAYMKYTVAGEPELIDPMTRGVVKRAAREGVLHLRGEALRQQLSPAELDHLSDQDLLVADCAYLGESLAVVALFRDADDVFSDEDAAALDTVRPIFAAALTGMVRDAHGPVPGGGDEAIADGEPEIKSDPDWWKRGEQPPF